jgi:ABC-2 type transport system permease protein
MISLRRVGVIVGHELRLQRRDPLPLMVLVVFPVITIAFLEPAMKPALIAIGHPHANGAEQVVPGQTAMSAFFLVSLITFSFFGEHAWVTWDRLRASAATSFEIMLGKSLPRIVAGIAQFAVITAAGVVLFGLHIRGNALALAPLVVAFTLCLVLLGVAVTAVCRTAQEANSIG